MVRNPCSKTITRQNSDRSWSFAIPRPLEGGTIIGGTKEPNVWDPKPSLQVREKLLSSAAKWFPFSENMERKFDTIGDIVGRRPARVGGFRLETEAVDVSKANGKKVAGRIVHAYGIGGRGVELSWGIAEDVVSHLFEDGVLRVNALL